MNEKIKYLKLFLLVWVSLTSCGENSNDEISFTGEPAAVELAEKMMTVSGGNKAWAEVRSLYVKAEHDEPQMDIPYQSQIWRALDTFQLLIEQENDSFHVSGYFTEAAGTITYLDKRDTFRTLSDEQLADWKFGHNHNVYVVFHELGNNPSNFEARQSGKEIYFYKNNSFYAGFELDSLWRPFKYLHLNSDSSRSWAHFRKLGTDQGLTHSNGGHPEDSSFWYTTEVWEASKKSFEELYSELANE